MPQEPLIVSLPQGDIGACCQVCGRLLVIVHGDGRFDLMGRAAVTATAVLSSGESRRGWPDVRSAVCLRWRCRFAHRFAFLGRFFR